MAREDDITPTDKPQTSEDAYVGNMTSLSFAESLEGFDEFEAVLHIKAPDGKKILRKCTRIRENGISEIKLEKELKDGIYRSLYLEYKLPKPLNNGRITKGHFGIGCRITAKGPASSLETAMTETWGFPAKTKRSNHMSSQVITTCAQ